MKKYFVILVLLALAIFISGCIGLLTTPGDDSIAPGKGRLEIYLTDAPGDYEEVNILISKIEGHIAVDGDEGYWEVLKEWDVGDELEVDLIELEDVSILLASLELVPNKYTQLRLFLMGGEEDAWIILEGSEGSTSIEFLEIPSVYQTGIKLIHPFEIVESMITKLTIDFDAEKSVVKTGNEEYKLKPVIKVISETYSVGDVSTGSVSGTVSYDENSVLTGIVGASVSFTLYGGEYIFTTSTVTDQDGLFFIEHLPVGTYTLNVSADDYIEHTEDGITVSEGVTTIDIDVVLTPVPQP